MHEAQMHDSNSMVNLTYSNEFVGPSLIDSDLTAFIKRARHKMKFRYFACGEYGEQTKRPHFHILMFGAHFADRKEYKQTDQGHTLYTSELLSQLWPWGHATIGAVTFESAAYVARYCTKKITGDEADEHYLRVDLRTGEIIPVKPEFARMSLKPAIGKTWFEKYHRDVFPHDHVISRGMEAKPPRYYDKLHELMNEQRHTTIKEARKQKALLKADDNTGKRLATKELVATAKLKLNKRGLE